MAVQNATVVKNPKTFWILTKVECILVDDERAKNLELYRQRVAFRNET